MKVKPGNEGIMGKKANWLEAVKRAFSPEPKEKKEKKNSRSKKKWRFGRSKPSDPSPLETETARHPVVEEIKLAHVEDEQSKHAYSVAIATAAAAEAAVVAAQAAVEIVRLAAATRFSGQSKEEEAATKIQTAFRGYLARKALRALRGVVRIKALIDGPAIRRQTTNTLRFMQTMTRIQSQIRSRRIKMTEENLTNQRLLQQKHEKELENLRASMGNEWDISLQSKEKLEANLLNKHEASIRRERALAYAFSHQPWRNSSRSINSTFMDPSNPHWGWSWLERWTSARPWENRSIIDKEYSDSRSVRSSTRSIGGEISQAYYARKDPSLDRSSLPFQKPSRPVSRESPSSPSKLVQKSKFTSSNHGWGAQEEDLRSMASVQSERPRRHSIAGSSVRDDESLASSPAIPNYMTPTESARAKSRLQSPSGINKSDSPDWGSIGSVKKRLSFATTDKHTGSPSGLRRHSGPPKIEYKATLVTTDHPSNKESMPKSDKRI